METKTIQLEESGLNIQDGKNMIFRIIDNQILNYKMQFQTEWERNHNTSPELKNAKIAELEATKKALNHLLDSGDFQSELSLLFNLEIKVQETKSINTSQSQLLAS